MSDIYAENHQNDEGEAQEHPRDTFTRQMMSNLDGEKDRQIAALVKALEVLLRFLDTATQYEAQHPADYSPYLNAKAVLADVSGAVKP